MDRFKKFLWRLSLILFAIYFIVAVLIEGIFFIIVGKPINKIFPKTESFYDSWADKIFK